MLVPKDVLISKLLNEGKRTVTCPHVARPIVKPEDLLFPFAKGEVDGGSKYRIGAPFGHIIALGCPVQQGYRSWMPVHERDHYR